MPASPAIPPFVHELRSVVRGRVVVPGDPGYDRTRAVAEGGFDFHPAALVRVADAADTAAVLRVARASGAELAVRSGGHSVSGHGTVEGGIVLDVRALTGLDIDVEGRVAWAGAGMTAAEYAAAVGAHGLATGFGDTGSVGIAGITLGGGIGYLVRRHGLTIDNLLGAEIVTADGEVLLTDEERHPDLFWAIRGGGGNFGVATRLCYRLHPLPSVVGGFLLLPATAEHLAAFMGVLEGAPEELSGIVNVMPVPPMPFVAPEHHGKMSIFALLAYAGDTDAGLRALAPLRAIAPPFADTIAEMPYPALFRPDEHPDVQPTAVGACLYRDDFGIDEARDVIAALEASDAPMRVVQLRALGGAAARVAIDATAYAHRGRRFMAYVAAFYEGVEERDRRGAWVDEIAGRLRGDDRAVYVNFLAERDDARVRDAYPGATWDRLRSVKRRYDPGNLFRHNHNIPPADA